MNRNIINKIPYCSKLPPATTDLLQSNANTEKKRNKCEISENSVILQ